MRGLSNRIEAVSLAGNALWTHHNGCAEDAERTGPATREGTADNVSRPFEELFGQGLRRFRESKPGGAPHKRTEEFSTKPRIKR